MERSLMLVFRSRVGKKVQRPPDDFSVGGFDADAVLDDGEIPTATTVKEVI